ncbi:hypothetical protein EDD99_7337 [Streptomyces sp. 846.5]|nr:hypothetical protein [Streptomyces sp. 846.5]TDT95505.1 hypothetical protein EDD99_7337 [Streptomyces sp. 846.5]
MPTNARFRTMLAAVTLAASLLVLPACSSSSSTKNSVNAVGAAVNATPTSSADRVRFAKTKFVANASLAAGAAYQWLYKPFKAGTFKSGAKGRTVALVKGGLAGAFTYNRLKAALNDAKGDPTLSKATDALSSSIESIKNLPSKIKGGSATDADFNQVQSVVDGVKKTASQNGLSVTDQVPSASQLTQMVTS